MRVILESTTKVVNVNGVPARIWQGKTESGIEVHAFITRIAINKNESRKEEFEEELIQCSPPSADVDLYFPLLRL